MKVVWIAGPYRAATAQEIEANIGRAAQRAQQAADEGHFPITPHLLTRGLHAPEALWLSGCLAVAQRADEVWLVDGWADSHGTLEEVRAAWHAKNTVRLPDGRRLVGIEARNRAAGSAVLVVERPTTGIAKTTRETIRGRAL